MKKKTSIMLDANLWEEVKIRCIKEHKDISTYLENLIRKDFKNPEKKEKSSFYTKML